MILLISSSFFFFFNDTATTEIYTLSLHDALPISAEQYGVLRDFGFGAPTGIEFPAEAAGGSEEHTSELQSRLHLVCRLLLEKKKKKKKTRTIASISSQRRHGAQRQPTPDIYARAT